MIDNNADILTLSPNGTNNSQNTLPINIIIDYLNSFTLVNKPINCIMYIANPDTNDLYHIFCHATESNDINIINVNIHSCCYYYRILTIINIV